MQQEEHALVPQMLGNRKMLFPWRVQMLRSRILVIRKAFSCVTLLVSAACRIQTRNCSNCVSPGRHRVASFKLEANSVNIRVIRKLTQARTGKTR